MLLVEKQLACQKELLHNFGDFKKSGREAAFTLNRQSSQSNSVMSVVLIRCQSSYYNEQLIRGVAEDRVDEGRTTSGNEQAGRGHHCCASHMTEFD